jgi:hypothetical protein
LEKEAIEKQKQDEMESLIRQMGQMSIEDPTYGLLYYRAITMDPKAEKVLRPPQFSSPPNISNNNVQTAPKIYARPFECFGCGEKDHSMNSCPGLNELMNQGVIKRGDDNKYVMTDGTRIFRVAGETLVDAANRLGKTQTNQQTAHFITLHSDTLMPDSEESFSVCDDEEEEVYAADRQPKVTKGIRAERFAGVFPPPLSRPKAKGKAADLAEASQSNPTAIRVKPEPVEIPLRIYEQPQTFDPSNDDAIMEDVSDPQPKAKTPRKPRVPHASVLSKIVDPQDILEKTLDAPITLSLREIMGVSKEISTLMQDVVRYKKSTPPEAVTNLAENKPNTHHGHGPLITVRMTIDGNPVMAIIDTGSTVNIMHKKVFDLLYRPINRGVTPIMNDANGGAKLMNGLVSDVPLLCGSVKTVADIFVAAHVPFDLLLGRPWQKSNLVSIEERMDGTYVVFRDSGSPGTRHELHLSPPSHSNQANLWNAPGNALIVNTDTFYMQDVEENPLEYLWELQDMQNFSEPPSPSMPPLIEWPESDEEPWGIGWPNEDDSTWTMVQHDSHVTESFQSEEILSFLNDGDYARFQDYHDQFQQDLNNNYSFPPGPDIGWIQDGGVEPNECEARSCHGSVAGIRPKAEFLHDVLFDDAEDEEDTVPYEVCSVCHYMCKRKSQGGRLIKATPLVFAPESTTRADELNPEACMALFLGQDLGTFAQLQEKPLEQPYETSTTSPLKHASETSEQPQGKSLKTSAETCFTMTEDAVQDSLKTCTASSDIYKYSPMKPFSPPQKTSPSMASPLMQPFFTHTILPSIPLPNAPFQDCTWLTEKVPLDPLGEGPFNQKELGFDVLVYQGTGQADRLIFHDYLAVTSALSISKLNDPQKYTPLPGTAFIRFFEYAPFNTHPLPYPPYPSTNLHPDTCQPPPLSINPMDLLVGLDNSLQGQTPNNTPAPLLPVQEEEEGAPPLDDWLNELARAYNCSFQANAMLDVEKKRKKKKRPSRRFKKLKKDTFGTITSGGTRKGESEEESEGSVNFEPEELEKSIIAWKNSLEESFLEEST